MVKASKLDVVESVESDTLLFAKRKEATLVDPVTKDLGQIQVKRSFFFPATLSFNTLVVPTQTEKDCYS